MSVSDKRLLKKMSKCTKNIYNSSLYCWKRWFDLHQLTTEYYANHLHEFLNDFSPKDRLTLGKYFKSIGKIEQLHTLVKHSHKSEIQLAQLDDSNGIEQLLSVKQKSILNSFEYQKHCIERITNLFSKGIIKSSFVRLFFAKPIKRYNSSAHTHVS